MTIDPQVGIVGRTVYRVYDADTIATVCGVCLRGWSDGYTIVGRDDDAHCIDCDYHPSGAYGDCDDCASLAVANDASGSHPDHDGLRAQYLDGWTCRYCDASR